MPRRQRNKAVRRLTKACESVMWMKTKDIRKKLGNSRQVHQGTLDIGSDVQIDLVGFYNDITLKITIENCLVNGILMRIITAPFIKIFALLKLAFLPAVLFTGPLKYVGNYVRSIFRYEQQPAAGGSDILEVPREEELSEVLENPIALLDQNENLTTNSNLCQEGGFNQRDQIHDDEVPDISDYSKRPNLARFQDLPVEAKLDALYSKFEKEKEELKQQSKAHLIQLVNEKLKNDESSKRLKHEMQKYKKLELENKHLKNENERLLDDRTCIICMDKEILYLFMPCKHLVSCENCAQNPSVKECPVCRKTIQKRLKTYMS